jgi:hypothetical protein
MKIFPSTFHRQKPMLIMSNGSERGDFVAMDHIFTRMARIHDGVQVLKAYYPYEANWSPYKKISEVSRQHSVDFAWDYEYEDYHPFNLSVERGDCLKQFRDIKCFGSDIHLTLALDLSLSDADIENLVRSLRPYGRIFLRINHECNGNWFRFNKYHSYKEVSDFFIRCHRIVKNNSSNIYTVFSLSGDFFAQEKVVKDFFLHLTPDEMKPALEIADYWSLDRYTSLHFGWPFEETVTPESKDTYFKNTVEDWWRIIEECYLNMIWHNKLSMKPLFINEFNSDSNVDGLALQAEIVGSVYDRIVRGDFPWLAGITFYQFRDLGGLGLQKGDLKDFQDNPVLPAYRDTIQKIHYHIRIEDWEEWRHNEYYFSWYHSDSIRGLCIRDIKKQKQIINSLAVPLYIVDNDQKWTRLDPKQIQNISKQEQLFVLVPPHMDKQGMIQYSYKVQNIREQIHNMLAVKSEVCY